MTDERPKHELQDPAEPYEAGNEVEVEPVTVENDPHAQTTHEEDGDPQGQAREFVDQDGLDEN